MRGATYQILRRQIADLRERKLVKKKPAPRSSGMMPGVQIDVVALEKYLPQLSGSSRKAFLALHDECKNAMRAGIALKMQVEQVKHNAYRAAKDMVEMIEEDLNSAEPIDSDHEKVLAQYLPGLSELQSQVYHLVNDLTNVLQRPVEPAGNRRTKPRYFYPTPGMPKPHCLDEATLYRVSPASELM